MTRLNKWPVSKSAEDMKRKNKVLARIEGWYRTMQAHILPDRDHCSPCISLSLFGPAICRKKSLWKSNFHFPWQLTRAWSNQGTHTVLFVPLRSAQQADELLKTTIFLLCLLFWQCYGFYLHQKPYLYSSTLSVIFAIKNIVFLYTCRWIFFKLPTITKIQ